MGKDGGEYFFSPVYVSLVDNKEQLEALDRALDVQMDIPERVLKRLKKYPRVVR